MNLAFALFNVILRSLDAETAHELTLRSLNLYGRVGKGKATRGKSIEVAGLQFPNRLGLAAGFDKNGIAIRGTRKLGFGFIEIGGVTPEPQLGNPKPRVFRLSRDRAVINRLGFNNEGVLRIRQNLELSRPMSPCVLGVNLGKGRDTPNEDAAQDYCTSMWELAECADYFTVNVSSPNTERLRDLQVRSTLEGLLAEIMKVRSEVVAEIGRPKPIFVKISPDLDPVHVRELGLLIERAGCDGIVACNTTINRDGLQDRRAKESGGLSGVPLFKRSLQMVEILRGAVGDEFAIVGVGGISSGADAQNMLSAGANLVQVYTGLIYRGPGLIKDILTSIG